LPKPAREKQAPSYFPSCKPFCKAVAIVKSSLRSCLRQPGLCCVVSERHDVRTPTSELALQIADQFSALGAHINLRCATVVGGIGLCIRVTLSSQNRHTIRCVGSCLYLLADAMAQALALAKNPHVVVATPGRLVDHLQNTKGFDLRSIKYLVRCLATSRVHTPPNGLGNHLSKDALLVHRCSMRLTSCSTWISRRRSIRLCVRARHSAARICLAPR